MRAVINLIEILVSQEGASPISKRLFLCLGRVKSPLDYYPDLSDYILLTCKKKENGSKRFRFKQCR